MLDGDRMTVNRDTESTKEACEASRAASKFCEVTSSRDCVRLREKEATECCVLLPETQALKSRR